METERFAVPELLFNPCDIGLNQAGIAEATWQSLSDIQNVRFETFSVLLVSFWIIYLKCILFYNCILLFHNVYIRNISFFLIVSFLGN